MSFKTKVLLKIISPLLAYDSKEIYDFGKIVQGQNRVTGGVGYAAGEVILRISRMASLVELVFSDDFEERAAQLLDADGTSVADNSTSKPIENDTK